MNSWYFILFRNISQTLVCITVLSYDLIIFICKELRWIMTVWIPLSLLSWVRQYNHFKRCHSLSLVYWHLYYLPAHNVTSQLNPCHNVQCWEDPINWLLSLFFASPGPLRRVYGPVLRPWHFCCHLSADANVQVDRLSTIMWWECSGIIIKTVFIEKRKKSVLSWLLTATSNV